LQAIEYISRPIWRGFRLLPALLALTEARAADWPQFRGPGAAGLGDGDPPAEWNGETGKNILWKTAIPGLAHSSPVVWGDRIFVTTAVAAAGESSLKLGLYGDIASVDGEGVHEFRVYCIDRRTGAILWHRTAASGVPKVKRHTKSTHANPTPATDGRRLIVSFGSEGLFAYDLAGRLLWKKDLGVLDAGYFRVPSAQWGYSSSPVISGGLAIVQADIQSGSFLAAFDVRTGEERWRTPRSDVPTFGTPGVAPRGTGRQIVVNGWKHIGGYDARTGRELWKLRGGGDIPVPTPVFANGLILITNAHGPGRPIYAIRPDASGDITGSSEAIAWSHERAGNYMQTPLAVDGLGYFCLDNGVLSVFQISTGERVYQQRLGGGTVGYSASPVAAGGRLYVTDEDGLTYVLALGVRYNLLARNELGEAVMASPAVSRGTLYIRGRRHLFAIGTR